MKIKITKKRIIYTIVVTFIVVFTTTFAILMTLERMDYRNYLQGQYSKNMYDLINSVQNIRVNLGKSEIIGSREQNIIVFSEIFRHASIANDKIHSLPIEQETIGDTSNFLSQVGDFCYSLATSVSEGRELTEDEYKSIDILEEETYKLEDALNETLLEINEGSIKWGEIRKKSNSVFAKNKEESITKKFKGIQKQVSQYPTLIYDGPFSDNILEIKPRILEKKEISQEQASEMLKNIFGEENILNIEIISSDGETVIPSYRFNITMKKMKEDDPDVVCEVSKNGGRITYLLNNRTIGEPQIDNEKAVEVGMEFLKKMGYENMISTYKLNYENYMVINYVYEQNDVMIYPDQIKIKIALDNGDVIGIEADKYLVSHIDSRKIPQPSITQNQASEKVGKRLNVDSVRLAIIPTETNKEILCYEFIGNYNDKNYIVYINAKTGYEQRIIEIINTPNGQLTI